MRADESRNLELHASLITGENSRPEACGEAAAQPKA
jgi:hypothetical protein